MAGSPTSVSQSLPREQTLMLLTTLPLMLVVELVVACVIGWLYWAGPAPVWARNLWLAAAFVLALYRARIVFRFRRQLHDPHANTLLPYRQLLSLILAGAALFAIATPLFNPLSSLTQLPDNQHRIYGVLMVALVIVGSASYVANLKALFGYILIVLLPAAAALDLYAVQHVEPFFGIPLTLFLITFLIAGRRIHGIVMRSLRTELRNRSLIQYLENARSDAEQLSEKLAREVFDRREARQRLQEAKERLEFMVGERTRELKHTNEQLATTGQMLQLALDASHLAMWEWNLETGSGYQANFEELVGHKLDAPHRVPAQIEELIHPDDLPGTKEKLARHFKGLTSFYESIYRMHHVDGHWCWIEDHGQVVARDQSGRATRMIGTRRDVTQAHLAEEQRHLAATVFENASEAIFILDTTLEFLAINDSFARVTGLEEAEVLGRSVMDTAVSEDERALYKDVLNILRSEGLWQGEVTGRRKGGATFPAWFQVNAVYDDQHHLTHYVCMFSDLTERKQGEEKLQFLSSHDRLTGLANRNQFRETLQRSLSMARLKRGKVALLYMNLDRFKPINDTLGHEVGDAILKLCAKRLLECGMDAERVARLDADEFTILQDYESTEELDTLCQRIIESLRQPYNLHNRELLLGTSIGISLYPGSAKDVRTMLSQSDIAMHQAKRMGGNNFQYYRSDMRMATVEQLALETSLRKALSKDEFVVYYQPKLDLRDGVIRGVEALVRWQHPTMGLLMPGTFIPLAEETGLITEIGEWVLNEACRQTALWHRQGTATITTSVNLSAHQFRSTDVLALVKRALDSSRLPPELLEMELTESLLMDDLESNLDILNQLRKLGVGLSLDDFGTGYSSLSYLKRFPIDELKVDRAFIVDLESNENDAAIAQAIISMAHSLRLKVVAEGVETQPQLEKLRTMGCDAIQGYLISRPVPAAEMEILLFQQRHRYNQS
jgi:diguanylate cyclase (GGDEF)-like protein/PAS domain S-box-containing protein